MFPVFKTKNGRKWLLSLQGPNVLERRKMDNRLGVSRSKFNPADFFGFIPHPFGDIGAQSGLRGQFFAFFSQFWRQKAIFDPKMARISETVKFRETRQTPLDSGFKGGHFMSPIFFWIFRFFDPLMWPQTARKCLSPFVRSKNWQGVSPCMTFCK